MFISKIGLEVELGQVAAHELYKSYILERVNKRKPNAQSESIYRIKIMSNLKLKCGKCAITTNI